MSMEKNKSDLSEELAGVCAAFGSDLLPQSAEEMKRAIAVFSRREDGVLGGVLLGFRAQLASLRENQRVLREGLKDLHSAFVELWEGLKKAGMVDLPPRAREDYVQREEVPND